MSKKISDNKQKRIMLEMLDYVDDICRRNGIKYSLIGGSLIGAIRHRGFVPWDDDIDIILTRTNYDKLVSILNEKDGKYQTLKTDDGGERFGFTKLVDIRTQLLEFGHPELSDNYGIFIDIFCYYSTSNNYRERLSHYKKIKLLRSLMIRKTPFAEGRFTIQDLRWACANVVAKILGCKRIKILFEGNMKRFEGKNSDYVVSNWPIYGFEKEIQLKKNTEEYIDVKFENLTVMIFKNYDEILRTSFGDYMQLPPESERIPKHNMTAWWREGYEDEAKKLRARKDKKEENEQTKR